MIESSITGLFRILLIIAAIYYGFRFLFRFVLPWILAIRIRNKQKQYRKQQDDYRSNTYSKNKHISDNIGEYIDFEEINDDESNGDKIKN